MNHFKEILPEELHKSPFQLIGKDWMLVTAEKDGKANTMTAAWGGFGVMWGKNVAYMVLRPHRYTKEFVDRADTFSLTFFDKQFKSKLGYLGTVSGRSEDKIAKAGLTVSHNEGTPYFEESHLAIFCKKLYAQAFKPECFIEKELDKEWYPEEDHHTLYIAEVERILIKE